MFLSLKFVILNSCFIKCIFCVVHSVVVDHEIPDEGMSHVLWQCYIIYFRTLIAAFLNCTHIYYWVCSCSLHLSSEITKGAT